MTVQLLMMWNFGMPSSNKSIFPTNGILKAFFGWYLAQNLADSEWVCYSSEVNPYFCVENGDELGIFPYNSTETQVQ